MSTQFRVCFIIYCISIIISVFCISYVFIKSKRNSLMYSMLSWQSLSVIWLIFGILEESSTTTAELFFFMKFTLFPIYFLAPTWFLFSLYYSKIFPLKSRPKTIYAIILVLLPSIILYSPAAGNSHFDLIVKYKDILNPSITKWGLFFNINYYLTFIFVGIGGVIVLKYALSSKIEKFSVFLLLTGTLIPLIVNIITSYMFISTWFDLTPISFCVSNLLVGYSVLRHRLFDPFPEITYDLFFDSKNAMVIYDTDMNVLKVNKEAYLLLRLQDTSCEHNLININELLHRFFLNYIDSNKIKEMFEQVKTSNGPYSCINITLNNDVNVNLISHPIPSKNGYVLAHQLTIVDITSHNNLISSILDLFFNHYKLENKLRPVFELLLEEKSNAQISSILNLSETTVRNYISIIYSCLLPSNCKNSEKRKKVINIYLDFKDKYLLSKTN